LEQSEVEPNSLTEQLQVGLAQIRDHSFSGSRLQDSQTTENRQARLLRHAPSLPFIDQNEIGRKSFGEKDRSPFAGAQTFARPLQGGIHLRGRLGPLDPGRPSYFLGTWKTAARNRHFMMDFSSDQDSAIQVREEAQLVDAGEGYKR